jgi:RNA polymerase sigma factor (sigma-70 family)
MRAASIHARAAPAGPLRSRWFLFRAGDGRLVEQVRRGNDAAFEVVFERHGAAILAFCRHMLGSLEEAEDAVQYTFAAAYRDLMRGGEREIVLKPWLFTIARNRCVSLLRARREVPAGVAEMESRAAAEAGLAEQVEERDDLRRLVADLRDLPHEQRAALLLTELGDLSHAEVADVLGCEVGRVKGLVFRARSALIARREARETSCGRIREQLANLRGGALRRTELRLHLRDCPGCRAYRDQVRQQRQLLAAALPVAPSLGLKSSVLAAIGLGGGSAGGGATAAGAFGGATLAKVAIAGALAGGGIVAGEAVVERDPVVEAPSAPVQPRDASGAIPRGEPAGQPPAIGLGGAGPARQPGAEARSPQGGANAGSGRGPIAAPPASTPVRRGPAEKGQKLWKTERAGKVGPPRGVNGKAKKEPPSDHKVKPLPNARGKANMAPRTDGKANGVQPGSDGWSAQGPNPSNDPRVRPNTEATGPMGNAGAEQASPTTAARPGPSPDARVEQSGRAR